VVDQFRADYVEQYGGQWTSGLRRLMSDGAWFRAAAYRHMAAMTCVGHSNIVTGAYPATHGVTANSWWDRTAGQSRGCVVDAEQKLVTYAGDTKGSGTSALNLMAPALPDEMRLHLPVAPRVVTLSLKDYTATMLAGHRADAATWFDSEAHGWVTSTAFTVAPVPFVQTFVAANPIDCELTTTWSKLLPDIAYLHEDDGAGEKGAPQWTSTFPHPLKPANGTADGQFFEAWQSSPLSDTYLVKMAEAAVDSLKLGQGEGTDYLAISFSALDLVGHDFGPRSHEVQDLLARLDRTLGLLFDHLDRRVGPDRYVVALTADHGVAPIPEQARAAGLSGGRLASADLLARINKALEPALGPGSHVARLSYTDLYFQPGVWDKLRANPDAMRAALDAARSMPGIARVLRADELEHRKDSPDRIERAAALNYFPGRSGDLIVVPRPYFFFSSGTTGTSHGSPYDYDQRVPLFLLGQGVRKGQYLSDASPIDIAPTLAWLCGITMSAADGRVLVEAIR
jgi:predicted AlkP superfamily pyrophosphatase or phosphodiesterase